MWRVLVGLHKEIKISFLPVGHTKFSPDWCFGLFKQQYRRTNIGCLDDIVQTVNRSATPNIAQLVGSQSGETIVPTFNWSDHFNEHTTKTALKGIKKMQHFHFSDQFPGQVKVKNDCDGNERIIDLRKDPSPQNSRIEFYHLGCLWSVSGTFSIKYGSTVLTTAKTWYALGQQRQYDTK